jgi:thiol-disulfide isomerase/thioredoxin
MQRTSVVALMAVLLLLIAWLEGPQTSRSTRSSATRAAEKVSAADSVALGRVINEFELRDHQGKPHSLKQFDDSRFVVVAFLGTECPLAKLYGPRLAELADEYAARGVQFFAVNSNGQDSLVDLANYVRIHNIPFPVLKDGDNAVADLFGAIRTPEVFLLDEQRRIRYWGRIDDQYSIGIQRDAPHRRDLAIAIDESLAGRPVSIPITESVGCHIGRIPKIKPTGEITYAKHVVPILRKHCVGCHRDGNIAPFPLTEYDEVVGWTAMIHEVVSEERMPPWFANPKHGDFKNDARLSQAERSLLFQWIENGCPAGDLNTVQPPPASARTWQIPPPEDVFFISDEPQTIPAEGEIAYQYFSVDPGFTEDTFIQAVEVRPGNTAVVHHALVSIATPDDIYPNIGNCGVLINYAPGMQPTQLPAGMAIHVPAGAKLLFQMHYTPNGSPQTDRTSIGIVYADPATVTSRVRGGAIANTQISIPAGKSDHQEVADCVFENDVRLISLSPHMHLRGKAFRYEAFYPDGRTEILLDVPKYDFNWQLRYVLKTPKQFPAGTRVRCTASYDNSIQNKANPDPETDVSWGDQTWQEMLIGFYGIVETVQD